MATSLQKVYDAFLATILEDEWSHWEEEQRLTDWRSLLDSAIPWFKFPRTSLEIDDDNNSFVEDLDNREIQILAHYMKVEWLQRSILTWENVKPLYEERDFSQANLLDKLNSTLTLTRKKTEKLESLYYRSIDNKSYDYTKWATYNQTS